MTGYGWIQGRKAPVEKLTGPGVRVGRFSRIRGKAGEVLHIGWVVRIVTVTPRFHLVVGVPAEWTEDVFGTESKMEFGEGVVLFSVVPSERAAKEWIKERGLA